MSEIVKPKVAQALLGGSGKRTKSLPRDKWPWYIWPEDQNSLQAAMSGTLSRPFKSKAEAEDCAKGIWWEKQP